MSTEPLLVPNPQGPEPIGEHLAIIRPGSPMAIIGLFVELIRWRFDKSYGMPWYYDNDIKLTKIAIESAYNEDDAHRNYRPAIYVDKDESTIGRTAVGDFVGQNLATGQKGFWGLNTIPILIECVAGKKGESMIIADLLQIYLHASSDLIQAQFGLHEMTPVNLGRTQPYERDKLQQWVTSVTFSIQVPTRWSNTPTTPIIRGIIAKFKASGATSENDFFQSIALRTT